MGGEWTSRPLRDCAVWYSGGTPSKGNPNYWNGDIPWISAKSLTEFFVGDSEDKVTEAGANNGTRLVPKDTILFIVRGMSLKSEFRMGITTRPVTFNQDLKALVAVDDVLPAFLAYAIKARIPEILGFVGEAGHGTGVLPTDRIQGLEIPLPPLDEQHAIARILGTLDDRIELNRQMNETLEAMARALFKSWFVDFDPVRAKAQGKRPIGMDPATAALFPSEFQDSELGEIPKGWSVVPFLDFADLLSGGTPKTSVLEYWNGSIKWASAKDVSQCGSFFLIDTERTITAAGLEHSATKIIPGGSVAVVARGATCGRFTVFAEDMAMNQTCYALVPRAIHALWYLRFLANDLLVRLVAQAHGSVFDTITTRTFERARTVDPGPVVLELFETQVSPVVNHIRCLHYENVTLAKLRDALLPRLLSGELSLAQAEQTVEATA